MRIDWDAPKDKWVSNGKYMMPPRKPCDHPRAEQRGDEWQCPDCMIAWPTTKLAGEIQKPRRLLKWYPLPMRPQS